MRTLVLGNKNYSSWSLRAWLAMVATGKSFREVVIPLFEQNYAERIREYSPTGKVPVLVDGDVRVWESLAIIDYLAERYPDAKLWPRRSRARAYARSISAEMHAGFLAVRAQMPMNVRHRATGVGHTREVLAEIERIQQIWRGARSRFGKGGPFLFGRWTAADMMFAPVVTRFITYGVELDDVSGAYVGAVLARPEMRRWEADAKNEPWSIELFDRNNYLM